MSSFPVFPVFKIGAKDPRVRNLTLSPSSDLVTPPLVPPHHYYVQGREESLGLLEVLPEKGLGIVGTRSPQLRSTVFLNQIVRQIQRKDWIVVSGLALGIDRAAHEAALSNGMKTIAFLGSGHDAIYPKKNFHLRQQILECGGLIISEYPNDRPAYAGQFLERNRLIALSSKVLWVVEAGAGSGALNTASWMRKLGRPVLATPSFPGDPAFLGNQQLLDKIDPQAHPFFGIDSFRMGWMDLSQSPSLFDSPHPKLSPEATTLMRRVENLSFEKGGVRFSELFEEFSALGWTPRVFFDALAECIKSDRLVDEKGVLLKK